MPDVPPLPRLSQREQASLIVLMSAARELTNPQLEDLAGFRLTGPERRTLNDLNYVASRRVGRGFAHELTAEGWHACQLLLTTTRPPAARTFGGALFALLAAMEAALDRRGLTLGEFFDPDQSVGPVAAASRVTEPDSPSAGADPLTVETAIRAAYSHLVKVDNEWVGLAPLRAELTAFAQEDVDAALRRLAKERGVNIIPTANFKSLTQADRDAALLLGGQYSHALAIEAR